METCSHCGLPIGTKELQQIWVLSGTKYTFHGKKSSAQGCKEKWRAARRESNAQKKV